MLAAAFDASLPLHSMVAAVGVGRRKPFSAALATRHYAEALPSPNEKFTRALAATQPGNQLLLFMANASRSTTGFVSLDGCREAKLSPETMLYCPLSTHA